MAEYAPENQQNQDAQRPRVFLVTNQQVALRDALEIEAGFTRASNPGEVAVYSGFGLEFHVTTPLAFNQVNIDLLHDWLKVDIGDSEQVEDLSWWMLRGSFLGFFSRAEIENGFSHHLSQVAKLVLRAVSVYRNQSTQSVIRLPRKQQIYLNSLIKYIPAPIAVFDRDMCYLAYSDRWLSDYNMDPAVSYLGRNHYELFPEILDMPEWLLIHQRAIAGESISCKEDKFFRADGRVDWVSYELRPWFFPSQTENAIPGGFIIWAEILTEHRKYERALEEVAQALDERVRERTAELERMNQAKSDFLARLTHEIRTPLNAILGFSQVLSRSSSLTDAEARKLSIINSSGEHLLDLVRNVLDLSKIESGSHELNLRTFRLRELLTSCKLMFSQKLRDAGMEVVIKEHSWHRKLLTGDPGILRQILINLINNAIKYAGRGRVTVDSSLYREPGHDQVILTVADEGDGIPESFRAKLFEPFAQAKTSHGSRGSGLGLTISRALLKQLGGSIDLIDSETSGLTFQIHFPVTVNHSGTDSNPLNPTVSDIHRELQSKFSSEARHNLEILIVDDNVVNAQLARDILESIGARVTSVFSGESCLRHVNLNQTDAIVLDLWMPHMDGFQTIERLRREGYRGAIIVMSASTSDSGRMRALSLGANEFVQKPYKQEVLLGAVTKHLKQRDAKDSRDKKPQVIAPDLNQSEQQQIKNLLVEGEESTIIDWLLQYQESHPGFFHAAKRALDQFEYERIADILAIDL